MTWAQRFNHYMKKLQEILQQKLLIDRAWIARLFTGTLLGQLVIPAIFGFLAGLATNIYILPNTVQKYLQDILPEPQVITPKEENKKSISEEPGKYLPRTSQEEAIIEVVKKASPAVVSIVASKDVPVFEQFYINPFEGSPFEDFFKGFEFQIPELRQKGTEKREISAGTGFIISEDGLILTNKHVVLDKEAEYTVYMNDGRKFEAKVMALDPLQDLAIVKIETPSSLPVVKLGDSSQVQIGQTVIAIGNALGEFRNTVSVGVVSGLQRSITASGEGFTERIEDLIQTDAAINKGNSGGPLLNLKGEVIGINTAIVSGAENIGFAIPINLSLIHISEPTRQAENIGFAIPINRAKRDIEQIKKEGRISYPFLGIYYTIITSKLKEMYDLPVDYGAWIGRDSQGIATKQAIVPGSPAAKAGLRQDDIILEINGEKISADHPLSEIIQKYYPGDTVSLKVLRDKEEFNLEIKLGERTE